MTQDDIPRGRFAPLDVDFTRRWVFPGDEDARLLLDQFDKLQEMLKHEPLPWHVRVWLWMRRGIDRWMRRLTR